VHCEWSDCLKFLFYDQPERVMTRTGMYDKVHALGRDDATQENVCVGAADIPSIVR